jgi:hypothetical protein
MSASSTDVAFTGAVKALQDSHGSREAYARLEAKGGWATAVTPDLQAFIAKARSLYFATANADGQPYVQHRGGPPGFLRALDDTTLAFADFGGNQQFITAGNLAENPRAFIFLMDYANRRRIKIWGRGRVSDDPDLVSRLFPGGYRARPERAIVFSVEAWDTNCPQHIPQMFFADDVAAAIERLETKIAGLEADNAALRAAAAAGSSGSGDRT